MNDRYVISSVVKALRTLKQFNWKNKEMTLKELSTKANINMSGMLRILTSLESEGFVKYEEESRKYRLGVQIFNLGNTAFGFLDIKRICAPYLKRAAQESQLMLHLAVIEDDNIVCIDKVWPNEHLDMIALVSYVGGNIPLHCTGVGKVLAAYASEKQLQALVNNCDFAPHSENTCTNKDVFISNLPQIRQQGYAFNDCENEPYLRCLTRPVFNTEGKCIAAVSLSGLKEVMTDEKLGFYNEISKRIMRELSKEFGFQG